jgi:hypothetical protein
VLSNRFDPIEEISCEYFHVDIYEWREFLVIYVSIGIVLAIALICVLFLYRWIRARRAKPDKS